MRKIKELVKSIDQKVSLDIRDLRSEVIVRPNIIWDSFISKNINFGEYVFDNQKLNKFSFGRKETKNNLGTSILQGSLINNIYKSRGSTSTSTSISFKENEIRADFLCFIMSLFIDYNDTKHYKIDTITNDLDFLFDDFIGDIEDVEVKNYFNLLKDAPCFDFFFQNLNYIVDLRYKENLISQGMLSKDQINIHNNIKEASLTKGFISLEYQIFLKSVFCIKNQKGLDKLVDYYTIDIITNTITIGNIAYDKLQYKQVSIFKDQIHRAGLKHDKVVSTGSIQIDKSYIELMSIYDKKKMKNNNVNRDSNVNLIINNKLKQVSSTKKNKENMSINKDYISKTNETMTNNTIVLHDNKINKQMENNLYEYFKSLIKAENEDLIFSFFGRKVGSNSTKEGYSNDIFNSKSKFPLSSIKHLTSPNQSQSSHESNKKLNMIGSILKSKDDNQSDWKVISSKNIYIHNHDLYFSKYIMKSKPIVEYHILFSYNTIQTASICDNCKKPNTIWDVRKEIYFEKDFKSICKFCNKPFLPYFCLIESKSSEEFVNKDWSVLYETVSKAGFRESISITPPDYIENKPKKKRYKYLPIEFICKAIRNEGAEFEYNNDNISIMKRQQYPIFQNVICLFNEYKIRCKIEEKEDSQQKTTDEGQFSFKISSLQCTSLLSYVNMINSYKTEGLSIGNNDKSTVGTGNIRLINNIMKSFNSQCRQVKKRRSIIEKEKEKEGVFKKNSVTSDKIQTYKNVNPTIILKVDYNTITSKYKYDQFEKEVLSIPNDHKKKIYGLLGEATITAKKNQTYNSNSNANSNGNNLNIDIKKSKSVSNLKQKQYSKQYIEESFSYNHYAIDEKHLNFSIIAVNNNCMKEMKDIPYETLLKNKEMKKKEFDLFKKNEKMNSLTGSIQDFVNVINEKGRRTRNSFLKINPKGNINKRYSNHLNLSSCLSINKDGNLYNKHSLTRVQPQNSFEERLFHEFDNRKTRTKADFTKTANRLYLKSKSFAYNSQISSRPFKEKTENRELNSYFLYKINNIVFNKQSSRRIDDYRVVDLFNSKRKKFEFENQNENEVKSIDNSELD